MYIEKIVPRICAPGNDENYGSSATLDVEVLQALSRRIHMGKFVAEAKFNDPLKHDEYVDLIKKKDRQGLMKLLTNEQVEQKLLARLHKKATIYGQEIDDSIMDPNQRIPVDSVASMYREFVIPLTKQVEVDYLLVRLDS